MSAFNRQRAARILVDAFALGDKTAADKHGVSEKSVQRYRQRLEEDGQLSALVRRLQARAHRDWSASRLNFLRGGIDKLNALVAEADVSQIRDVAEAVKVVGELQVASDALNVGDVDHLEGDDPSSTASDAGEGGTDPVH